jgi:signal recognition particle receptor subunit beta
MIRHAEPAGGQVRHPRPVKIVVAGGFGVGKTTAVSQISEIPIVTTSMSGAPGRARSAGPDGAAAGSGAADQLDCGRLTIDDEIVLYLFGAPGHDRYGFMRRELIDGALGALILVDTRLLTDSWRLDDCYAAVEHFERAGLPYVVAVNLFDGAQLRGLDDVRSFLAVPPGTPVVTFDARDRSSVRDALVAVLRQAMLMAAPSRVPPQNAGRHAVRPPRPL